MGRGKRKTIYNKKESPQPEENHIGENGDSAAETSPPAPKRSGRTPKAHMKNEKTDSLENGNGLNEESAASTKTAPVTPVRPTGRQPKTSTRSRLNTPSKSPPSATKERKASSMMMRLNVEKKNPVGRPKKVKAAEEAEGPTQKKVARKEPVKKAKSGAKQYYEVEEIIESRVVKGKEEFLIKWKGYPTEDNSWVPINNLKCEKLLKQFRNKV